MNADGNGNGGKACAGGKRSEGGGDGKRPRSLAHSEKREFEANQGEDDIGRSRYCKISQSSEPSKRTGGRIRVRVRARVRNAFSWEPRCRVLAETRCQMRDDRCARAGLSRTHHAHAHRTQTRMRGETGTRTAATGQMEACQISEGLAGGRSGPGPGERCCHGRGGEGLQQGLSEDPEERRPPALSLARLQPRISRFLVRTRMRGHGRWPCWQPDPRGGPAGRIGLASLPF